VNFKSFLFLYFEIPKSSIFVLSFWRFHMGRNNVGDIDLKFGGFQICFNGIQGSSTLFLGIVGVFPKKISRLELVVPFCLHHLFIFSQN